MAALLAMACVTLVIPAHPTPDMDGVRLALHIWAQGLLNGDDDAIASVLHDDLTTSEGENRDEYLKTASGRIREIDVTQVLLQYAYYQSVENDIRVGPVVILQERDLIKTSLVLTFRQRGTSGRSFRSRPRWSHPLSCPMLIFPSITNSTRFEFTCWMKTAMPRRHEFMSRTPGEDTGLPMATRRTFRSDGGRMSVEMF